MHHFIHLLLLLFWGEMPEKAVSEAMAQMKDGGDVPRRQNEWISKSGDYRRGRERQRNRGTVKVTGEMTHSCRRTQNHSSAWIQSHLRLTRDLSTNKTPNYNNKMMTQITMSP